MRCVPILALLFLLSSRGALAHDHMGMHSLFPPILQNYWDNGLNYWSFGSEAVVTDDMVRLTNPNSPKSHGYLWNRHGNHLGSWEMNVTLQFSALKINTDSTYSSKKGASAGLPPAANELESMAASTGAGIWFTTDTPRHGDRKFFGAPSRFNGIGIGFDHKGTVSVFVNDGFGEITDVPRQRKGFCRVNSRSVTITAKYVRHSKTLYVSYVPVDKFYETSSLVNLVERTQLAADPNRRADLSANGGHCATIAGVDPVTHSYFGVTAANSVMSSAKTEVQSFFVKPVDWLQDDEEERVGLKVFDRLLDVQERKAATGREDVPSQEADPFNFPPADGDWARQKLRPSRPLAAKAQVEGDERVPQAERDRQEWIRKRREDRDRAFDESEQRHKGQRSPQGGSSSLEEHQQRQAKQHQLKHQYIPQQQQQHQRQQQSQQPQPDEDVGAQLELPNDDQQQNSSIFSQ